MNNYDVTVFSHLWSPGLEYLNVNRGDLLFDENLECLGEVELDKDFSILPLNRISVFLLQLKSYKDVLWNSKPEIETNIKSYIKDLEQLFEWNHISPSGVLKTDYKEIKKNAMYKRDDIIYDPRYLLLSSKLSKIILRFYGVCTSSDFYSGKSIDDRENVHKFQKNNPLNIYRIKGNHEIYNPISQFKLLEPEIYDRNINKGSDNDKINKVKYNSVWIGGVLTCYYIEHKIGVSDKFIVQEFLCENYCGENHDNGNSKLLQNYVYCGYILDIPIDSHYGTITYGPNLCEKSKKYLENPSILGTSDFKELNNLLLKEYYKSGKIKIKF